MTSLVTLQALSNDVLLIEDKKQNLSVKKPSRVYSKTRVALLEPYTDQH